MVDPSQNLRTCAAPRLPPAAPRKTKVHFSLYKSLDPDLPGDSVLHAQTRHVLVCQSSTPAILHGEGQNSVQIHSQAVDVRQDDNSLSYFGFVGARQKS